MHLCSLSITYACPYHNPTTIMGHSIHNVDISKLLTHTTTYTLSVICPVQWKPGFIHEENSSPKCQTPSNVSICPLKLVTMTNCSQVETPMRTTSMQMSFPETVSDSLCRNSLVMQTDCCSSCQGGWSQTILEVNMLDVEVLFFYLSTFYNSSQVVKTKKKTKIQCNLQSMLELSATCDVTCIRHESCALPTETRHCGG